MNPIAFALEMLLASLLMAALMLGIRLDRRMKALRESQAGFEGAVAELNAAIARAEAGLAELKGATKEAQELLADRLQDAKGAAAKLTGQVVSAEDASQRLEKMIERATVIPAMRPPPRPRWMEDEPLTLRREALSTPAPAPAGEPAPFPRFAGTSPKGGRSWSAPTAANPPPLGEGDRAQRGGGGAPILDAKPAPSPARAGEDEKAGRWVTRFRGDERSNPGPLARSRVDEDLFEIIEPALRAARSAAR